MKWYEITVYTTDAGAEPVCGALTSAGLSGFSIEESREKAAAFLNESALYWDFADMDKIGTDAPCVKAYLAVLPENAPVLEEAKAAIARLKTLDLGFDLGTLAMTVCVRDEEDWANNWKQYYKPLEIGDRLIVVPEWEETDLNGRVPLRLDPGLMFGTGSHATTRMCLEALQNFELDGKKVLDLGCGSGILGIGALVLGAGSCVGCDIDPKAPDVVMDNAALNGIGADRLKVYAGDIIGDAALRRSLGMGYDIVLANIVSDVIIPLAPLVRPFMAQDAVFITSGIIDGRETDVAAALKSAGFEIKKHLHEEEWHCYICK